MPGATSSTHALRTVTETGGEEENDMYSTDSFLGAELAYRQERIRKDYGSRRWTRVRADDTRK